MSVFHGRGHAFISYAHSDSDQVDALQRSLEAADIPVWRDTMALWPGEDWRIKIRHAIASDSLVFIACFSRLSVARSVSYQHEELVLAIEQLRLRRPEDSWFIPVRLDECEIPDRDIGAGRTLASIQYVDIFGDHATTGTARIISAALRIFTHMPRVAPVTDDSVHLLAPDSVSFPDLRKAHDESTANSTHPSAVVSRPTAPGHRSYRDYKPYYHNYRPKVDRFMFNLTSMAGGLVVYADASMRGQTFKVLRNEGNEKILSAPCANVVERLINGQTEFAAVFSSLTMGGWILQTPSGKKVEFTVYPYQIAEIDLR